MKADIRRKTQFWAKSVKCFLTVVFGITVLINSLHLELDTKKAQSMYFYGSLRSRNVKANAKIDNS